MDTKVGMMCCAIGFASLPFGAGAESTAVSLSAIFSDSGGSVSAPDTDLDDISVNQVTSVSIAAASGPSAVATSAAIVSEVLGASTFANAAAGEDIGIVTNTLSREVVEGVESIEEETVYASGVIFGDAVEVTKAIAESEAEDGEE